MVHVHFDIRLIFIPIATIFFSVLQIPAAAVWNVWHYLSQQVTLVASCGHM